MEALQLSALTRGRATCAELENEIERAVALADDGHPSPPHLSERIVGGAGAAAVPALRTLNEAVEALKRRMIEDALRECGSKTRAAERLGSPGRASSRCCAVVSPSRIVRGCARHASPTVRGSTEDAGRAQ